MPLPAAENVAPFLSTRLITFQQYETFRHKCDYSVTLYDGYNQALKTCNTNVKKKLSSCVGDLHRRGGVRTWPWGKVCENVAVEGTVRLEKRS